AGALALGVGWGRPGREVDRHRRPCRGQQHGTPPPPTPPPHLHPRRIQSDRQHLRERDVRAELRRREQREGQSARAVRHQLQRRAEALPPPASSVERLMDYPLEPSGSEMRALVDSAMRRIVAHIESLPAQPASNVEGAADFARGLIEPMPRGGGDYESLLDTLFNDHVPRSFNAAGPGYLAFIPGGGIFHSAIADLIAD